MSLSVSGSDSVSVSVSVSCASFPRYAEFLARYGVAIAGGEYEGLALRGSGKRVAHAANAAPATASETSIDIGGGGAPVKPARGGTLTAAQVRAALGAKLSAASGSVTRVFMRFDRDRSGALDHHEFRSALATFNLEMTDAEFAKLMRELDPDGSGKVGACPRAHGKTTGKTDVTRD